MYLLCTSRFVCTLLHIPVHTKRSLVHFFLFLPLPPPSLFLFRCLLLLLLPVNVPVTPVPPGFLRKHTLALLLKFYVKMYTHIHHTCSPGTPLLSRQSLSKCFLFVFGLGKDRPFLCLPVLILIVPGLILSIN